MADESYFQQIINALRGNSGPKVTTNLAPPLSSYPSSADADYARQYGFSENSPNQAFLDNKAARVLGQNVLFGTSDLSPKKNKNEPLPQIFIPNDAYGQSLTKLTQPGISQVINPQDSKYSDLKGILNNRVMQAALAVNRNPIAAVGFDPDKITMDVMTKNPTYGGAYNKETDRAYTNFAPEDAIAHESTHRGLQKLRELYPKQTEVLMGSKNSPIEELIVRRLMQTLAGDPEKSIGAGSDEQRKQAIMAYKRSSLAPEYNKSLEKLQELAIEAMKNRGKRAGPQ
jgi:hypothetical protein